MVSEEIRGPGMLRGGYDTAEAMEVAALLQSGNLPVALDVESIWSVGSTLGAELQERGFLALVWSALGLCGLLALAYGRRPVLLVAGLLSLTSLLFFTIGLISLFGLTVDLVAIAGLVLSIGMGMDAFILVFEALEGGSAAADPRSPLGKLRSIYSFRSEGRTLVHANATTLLVVLLLFSSERLQSFALFVIVGIMASLLTLVLTRWTLMSFARRGWMEGTRMDGESTNTNRLLPTFQTRLRRYRPRIYRGRTAYFVTVGLFLLTSAVLMQTGYLNSVGLGSDFQPGVQIQLAASPEQVRALVDDLRATFSDTTVRHQTVSIHNVAPIASDGDNELYLVTMEGSYWHGDSLTNLAPVLDRHGTDLKSVESVDARLSARRILASLSALVLSFTFLGVYLGPLRRWIDRRILAREEVDRCGRAAFLGTFLAVLLDVTVVLVALVWFGIPLGLPELAALLTIVGYSVNDSMVLFSHLTRPDPTGRDVTPRRQVERVVDRILARTVLTSASTMVPAVAILAVGLEPLAGFAWAVIVGTISGTLSSIFVVSTFLSKSSSTPCRDKDLDRGTSNMHLPNSIPETICQ